MAHAALHFSLGMAVASAYALPPLLRAARNGTGTAQRFRNWVLLSYLAGTFAIAPSLLVRMGVPTGFARGWWMNVFLFHPVLTRVHSGGTVVGPMVLCLCFAIQYGIGLILLRRLRAGGDDRLGASGA